MRLDHVAFRVADRHKTVDFFVKAFGYRIQTEFDLKFDDNTTARCFALEPPEKVEGAPWTYLADAFPYKGEYQKVLYHTPPEIFVSDGDPDSIVGQWVANRNGIGGLHHMAYQVDSVQQKMDEWKEKGYAEFSSDEPMKCENLIQVFSKPSFLTGTVFEFIQRGEHGFCKENVRALMESSKGL